MITLRPVETSTITVLGVVRNADWIVGAEIDRIYSSLKSFKKIFFFVVESDSDDKTINALKLAEQKYEGFSFISLGRLENSLPERTERIAMARNMCIATMNKNVEARNSDYYLVVDLDGVNCQLNRSAVESCWEAKDWEVATANQPKGYYDIYALRHPDWSVSDCWNQKNSLVPIMGEAQARQLAITSKIVQISRDSLPIKVSSAFGGAAIYSRDAFKNLEYVGIDEAGKPICEHVIPNLKLNALGAKIKIIPSFVNINSIASIRWHRKNFWLQKVLK